MNDPVKFSKYNLNTMGDVELWLNKYKGYLHFKGCEDMLEIGCSSGKITKEVLYPFVEKYLNSLLAVDIWQNAISKANQLYNMEKISFRQMDICEENLWITYKEKFGHIFAFFLLHLLKKPETSFQNIFKMLKQNGQFFALVLLPTHPTTLIINAQKGDKTAPWVEYMDKSQEMFTNYGPNRLDGICNILRSTGFRIDSIEEVPSIETYKTVEDLNGFFLSINWHLEYIPKEMRDAYVEDYLKRVLEHVGRTHEGSYYYTKYVGIILATKL